MKSHIPYYEDFLSPALKEQILKEARTVVGVPHLLEVDSGGGLENKESLKFLCELYGSLKDELKLVLERRTKDRKFIDERNRACLAFNQTYKRDFTSADYKTAIGLEDGDGRIVMGPKRKDYWKGHGASVATIPDFLQGNHVTLFGPPDNAKLSINAMNAFHRQLKGEPQIVRELLSNVEWAPKWGADDEDSKTPMREDLVEAGVNLTKCFEGTLSVMDGKKYVIENEKQSLPIKRFPGLALPCFFLFYENNPLPLHLYDFAMHFFANWQNKRALTFYVPKLENEEEARYICSMMRTAEEMMKRLHPEYELGSIRLMIVLENPRAIFRLNEMMDELYPYFVGASLGWHDYLASTARLFKEDPNYRIPVKADPDIVIKYIKASHDLLAAVVGPRGGVKVGGMYGILPVSGDLKSPSFQVTIKGYIRDVITQFKRNLTGFWVAHPDFVRLGVALVEGWKIHKKGDSSKLTELVTALLDEKYHKEVLDFIHGPDSEGLKQDDPRFARSLIVADLKESSFISNNHPDEIRYNVFQSLQYITDWLSGNGCVALPAQIAGVPVRVMDDLATAERSRWEVWHEIRHGRFGLEEFLKIAFEELHFIRKDRSDEKKIVQVKWDARTEKWYPVALRLMIKLMTDPEPVEFATQLFLPFTVGVVRKSEDPWAWVVKMDPQKFAITEYVERFIYFFEMCGSLKYAKAMAQGLTVDFAQAERIIRSFSKADILDAAGFHGDIGESKKTLDKLASSEQAQVLTDDEEDISELKNLGQKYRGKFGMKFLVSAQGRGASELLSVLRERFENPENVELNNAREALWEITRKRMIGHHLNSLHGEIQASYKRHGIQDAQVSISTVMGAQTLCFGKAKENTWFELASLSKTIGSAFALEYFRGKGISLKTSVNQLLGQTKSSFRLENGDGVTLEHLMSHSALNLHYVNGVPANREMPPVHEFLRENKEYGYVPIEVINPPGEVFQYSGGGFLVLEHLIEAMENMSIYKLTRPFLDKLGLQDLSFEQHTLKGVEYANGYNDKDELIEGTRKMFPAFAAGCMGTSSAVNTFLSHLEKAFHDVQGPGGISHDTAVHMLHGTDKGCMKFMGVKMGLGVFVGEAGPNKFAIHQGANDGFRCIFLHCFQGPDQGKGLTVLCNGDLKGVLFNAEVAQLVLKAMKIEGIDFDRFKHNFSAEIIPQEEVVNLGYKNLVFDAFVPTRPEPIEDRGPLDPLATYNLCVGAKVLEVSDERFARAENLLNDHLPKFDPELFGKQGKVMDSWESVRHNLKGVDQMVFEFKRPSSIRYVQLSTKYHFGNHTPFIKLEGSAGGDWVEFLPKTGIDGHSEKRIRLEEDTGMFTKIRVSMYPDGGFTRLGLYNKLPEGERESFNGVNVPYAEMIPHPKKPLSISYEVSAEELEKNWSKIGKGEEFNNASLALGARILRASNEHYGPAVQMISPFSPINMFDGLESARSRAAGHFDEVTVALARPASIVRIEMDFTYFVNNNPLEVEVEGLSEGKWLTLVERTNVKAFAGNKKTFDVTFKDIFEQVRLKTIPDGGMNRLKIFSKA